jgi:cytochrome c5
MSYRKTLAGGAILAFALPLAVQAADTGRARTGKQVVDEVCIKCHGTGENGAPRIGDAAAWKGRSARSLTALSQSAIKGIRNMPPHGARMDLSDVELKRAVTYMVNQSGGHWIEPADPAQRTERTGKEIVQARCHECHETGKGGAPKIGDRTAWVPRLAHGFNNTVASAINGHGGMPARGGLPDLTDREVRSAIVYMLNPDPK